MKRTPVIIAITAAAIILAYCLYLVVSNTPTEHTFKDGKIGIVITHTMSDRFSATNDLLIIQQTENWTDWAIEVTHSSGNRNLEPIEIKQPRTHPDDQTLKTIHISHWTMDHNQPAWHQSHTYNIYFYPKNDKADKDLLRKQIVYGLVKIVQIRWKPLPN